MSQPSNTASSAQSSWLPETVSDQRAIAYWLLSVCALLVVMILLGGATRLTDSGLSITEWRPVTGAIPPLSDADWAAEFEKYKQIPQYQLINKGMSLAAFKTIYWWEWSHRFLGRLIGLLFFVPFVYFLFRRMIDRALFPKLVLMFVLGGAQGFLGWYMVKSGLSDRVDVSQYRLAAHLGLAFIIYGFILWVVMDLLRSRSQASDPPARYETVSWTLGGLIYVQILLGALVAGLDAGLSYNTWPLMDGGLIPSGLFSQSPWIANFFENRTTVQFDHRMVAYLITAVGAGLWYWTRQSELAASVKRAADLVLAAIVVQVLLGIWTLLAVAPLSLSLLHQLGAVVLLSAVLYHLHTLRDAKA